MMRRLAATWLWCGWLNQHQWTIMPRLDASFGHTRFIAIEVCRRCGTER